MTIIQAFIFFTVTILGICLTVISMRSPQILLRFASFLTWFALGIMMITNAFGTSIGDAWTAYLGWVFIVLAFASLLLHMDTEITKEKNGQKWTEWGARPKDKETSYERYKAELRSRTRR